MQVRSKELLVAHYWMQLTNLRTSAQVKLNGGRSLARGDVAMMVVDGLVTAGELWFFFDADIVGATVCAQVWTPRGGTAEFPTYACPQDAEPRMLPMGALMCSVAYVRDGDMASAHVPVGMRL